MTYLIAGLGNIGAEYELTRHNIGFLVLDRLADQQKAAFRTTRLADKAEFKFRGRTIHLIKPSTYMNLSGRSVSYWLQALKVPRENLLVVVDDVALPFGTLRMRTKGSSAGHNGLKSMEETLGDQVYSRLRFGIGSDYSKGQQIDYVLGNFTQDQFNVMTPLLDKAAEMILSFCAVGAEKTMSSFNG